MMGRRGRNEEGKFSSVVQIWIWPTLLKRGEERRREGRKGNNKKETRRRSERIRKDFPPILEDWEGGRKQKKEEGLLGEH